MTNLMDRQLARRALASWPMLRECMSHCRCIPPPFLSLSAQSCRLVCLGMSERTHTCVGHVDVSLCDFLIIQACNMLSGLQCLGANSQKCVG